MIANLNSTRKNYLKTAKKLSTSEKKIQTQTNVI